MKKLLVLVLLVLAVLSGSLLVFKNATAEQQDVELTDEQIVRHYLYDEYGENDYEIVVDDTTSYNYLIAYRAYEDGSLQFGGAINRDHYKNLYSNEH